MDKTLYVSDLDGTLMQPAPICRKDNSSSQQKHWRRKAFTVATARTPATVAGIIKDVKMSLPQSYSPEPQ